LGFATPPKNPKLDPVAVISGMGKAADFKLAGTFAGAIDPNKSQSKIWEKRERGRIYQGLPNFFRYPQLSQERLSNGLQIL